MPNSRLRNAFTCLLEIPSKATVPDSEKSRSRCWNVWGMKLIVMKHCFPHSWKNQHFVVNPKRLRKFTIVQIYIVIANFLLLNTAIYAKKKKVTKRVDPSSFMKITCHKITYDTEMRVYFYANTHEQKRKNLRINFYIITLKLFKKVRNKTQTIAKDQKVYLNIIIVTR